jgi:crossover junction endodeoxyribonuclease RuvC
MRVLGIDPGTVATGWGVVEDGVKRLSYVAGGVLRPRGCLVERLAHIYEQIGRLVVELEPDCVSLEKSFVGDNVQTAFRLGEARGAILVAVTRAGVPISEYTPAQIKVAMVGQGRATKPQVQTMVGHLLALPPPIAADEADALGAAICHLHTQSFAACVQGALSVYPRTSRHGWSRRLRQSRT